MLFRSESLRQVHFPAFPMSVRRAVFVLTVSPGPWVATKESPFEFLQVDAPSWLVSSMKSPNDVSIPGVMLEPLSWVVEEPVGSVLFLVEVKGESWGVESPVAPRSACWRWGSQPVASANEQSVNYRPKNKYTSQSIISQEYFELTL